MSVPYDSIAIFALSGTQILGHAVARALGRELAPHEERRFERGEFKVRAMQSVRERHAYVIHSLYGDSTASACDKLCELLFLAGSLRDAGATHVSAVIPYLAFARKDRRTKARDPVTARYVAQMIESIGVDHVMAIEVHNPAAFDNAHRIRADHLTTTRMFADHFARQHDAKPLAVVSPDLGGAKRAQLLREALQRRLGEDVAFGCVEKRRSAGVVSGHYLIGDVAGRAVILLDDLISTGTTLLRAAQACRAAGAVAVQAVATHAPVTSEATIALTDPALDGVTITDTVALDSRVALDLTGRLTVLPVAGLIANAIDSMHGRGSLSKLLELD